MKRAYFIHGWSESPEQAWFPWLKQKLEKQGYEVHILQMPNPDYPTIREWIPFLTKNIQPTPETILIGHSIGCQTILRYLETLPKEIVLRAIFCIAGWFTLNELETEEEKEIAEGWLTTPIDFAKIKTHAKNIYAILSENDPYVPLKENERMFKENLNAETHTVENYGHIWTDENVRELPLVLEITEKL
ncbi:MAG: alpha/beta hydrolase [Candidatus Paceibacterota bacterium]